MVLRLAAFWVPPHLMEIYMYTVELDVHVVFVPPMEDNSDGIVMTRSFELPFPPHEGLSIYHGGWEGIPDGSGFVLKDVVWDVERELFLASSRSGHHNFPIAGIAAELSDWIGRGWRFGSYKESYDAAVDHSGPGRLAKEACKLHETSNNYEVLHTLPPDERPAAFNALMKALVRHMARSYHDAADAYAIDKTGRCLKSKEMTFGIAMDPASREYLDRRLAYERLDVDGQIEWMRGTEKYPKIESLVEVPSNRSKTVGQSTL